MSEPSDQNESQHDERPEPFGAPEVPAVAAPVAELDTSGVQRKRLKQLAMLTALAAAVFVVVLLATGSNGSSAPKPAGTPVAGAEQTIGALLAGIPESKNVLGKPTAPVTLRWFGDLECPFCREFSLGALPAIIDKWVRGGQLKIEYRSIETATHQLKVFEKQEVAALAAGTQDKMWYFLETFFHEQGEENSGYVTDKFLRGIARQVPGLNQTLWAEDRHNPQLIGQLAEDQSLARRVNFTSTPSFLIGKSGSRNIDKLNPGSNVNPAAFNKAIEYVLKLRRPGVPRAIPASFSAEQMSKSRA